jgi:hypothetical protein
MKIGVRCIGWKILTVLAIVISADLTAEAKLSDAVQQQMVEIFAFKQTFSPAEQKLSTNLVLLTRQARNMPLGSLASLIDTSSTTAEGKVAVEIGAYLSPSLISSAVMTDILNGTDLPGSAFAEGKVHAEASPLQLLALASSPDVNYINDIDVGKTNVGSVTSQGYVTHTANKLYSVGIGGAGVNVGVLSDSASAARVAALITSGDLPANVTVVPGQASSGTDEGAAMMEIVHDLAPGANLFFATANGGQVNFANNIRTLRFVYHCDFIADDVTYFAEGAFQDGTVAKAVNDVVADGALYFSSAANSGNLTFGTSGTWEGDFLNGGIASPLINNIEGAPVLVHNFGTAESPILFDRLTSNGFFGISLKWSDPLAAASDDYDLFVLNAAGTAIKGLSVRTQTGTQDPFEMVSNGVNCGTPQATGYCPAAGDQIVVVLYSGSPRALRLDTNEGTLTIATSGSTYGHNAGQNTMSIAATYWNSAKIGTKPFTGAANPIEFFSADGPRKIFFNPDGTEITPGNLLFATDGGTTLQKPDVTAADGVSTRTPGFLPFFGTSAAAPHAAAIAALVKSASPTLTNTQIRSILLSTTVDNMAPGVDRDSGYGIMMALPAVQAALTLP